MELKNYQRNTLNVLRRFFTQSRIVGHPEAFRRITAEPEIASRLVSLKNGYTVWDSIPHIPRVCLKVSAGGGKTIMAAHAAKIAAETICEKDNPLVLWFVPSDTIRRQTVEAPKNKRHPYRQALDEQFSGKVRIFDLDDKFNLRPDDIAANVCIVVSTMQSFVKADTAKYNVYRDNENLDDHFVKMPAASYAGMEFAETDNTKTREPKYSFANLLFYHRPLMIVDEAHKVVTDLSQETLGRINPAAIIEFTATPRPNNNTLYNVRAAELKEEEMIKLPIALVEHSGWETAVDEALRRRAELEKEAAGENDYIRPVLLFQAQSKDKEVTVGVLKNYLLETSNIPENQIKTATGEQKELDGIDIFNPNEPTRYIITVEALKEGWDCSFAYVLCSLANVKSDTSVEQLLGRVMRMPYARTCKNPALNKAYAYVVSPHFGEAAAVLTEKLINKGFDDGEAQATIQQELPKVPDLDPSWNMPFNQYQTKGKLNPTDIPASIQFDKKDTLFFTPETSDEDIKKLCGKLPLKEVADVIWKFENYRKGDSIPSPASKGIPFIVPRLMFETPHSGAAQGELLFADPDTIFEAFDWNIGEYAESRLTENEFNIDETGKGYFIDIDGNRLQYTAAEKDRFLPQLSDAEIWTPANLCYWLDKRLKQKDIPQAQMLEWLRRTVEYLMDTRKLSLASLMPAKYALLNKLLSKIASARQQIKE
jgi:type III restriction enzyme